MSNSLGQRFRITSFGESHGKCIGVVLDGCPAGLLISIEEIQRELDRRRPGEDPLTSKRKESDRLEMLSGVFKSITTGAPICMLVRNIDHDSSEYERIRWTPRPGHADLSTYLKYGGFNDYRGGGRSSGRITAGYVMAGSIAKKVLNKTWGTEVIAYTKEIGGIQAGELSLDEIRKNVKKNPVRCGDPIVAEKMVSAIKKAYYNGDSLGGIISCIASNMPPGVGEPVFDTLEGELSKALFSIPAVKAVDFGLGHLFSSLSGSESNDPYIIRKGKIITETNKGGGILGGISVGMPIKLNVTFKPTPSIRRKQRTIDLRTMEETTIEVIGRHDPCIVPRAIPVVESIVSIVLVDQGLRVGLIPTVMEK